MFASKPNYLKLRTNLRLCINRLKLLEKKKTELALKARREIADYILAGKDDRARIRVEHIVREDYLVEAMEIVEMLCDLLLARFGLIERMSELDPGIEEAVATLIWVAPRLSGDIQEIREVANQLTIKYGKEFGEICRRNTFESVNEKVVHKMSLSAPPKLLVEHYMIEIARTYKVPFEPDPLVMMGQPPEASNLIDLGIDALSPMSGMGTNSTGSTAAHLKAMEAGGQMAGGGGGPLVLPSIPGSVGSLGMGYGSSSGGGVGGGSSGYNAGGTNNGYPGPGVGGGVGGGGGGGYGYSQPGGGGSTNGAFGYSSSGGTSVGASGVFGTAGGVSSGTTGYVNAGQNLPGGAAYGTTGGASSSSDVHPLYENIGKRGAAAGGGVNGFPGGFASVGGNTGTPGGGGPDYSGALVGGVPVLPSEGQFPPPVPDGYLPPSGVLPSSHPSHPSDSNPIDTPRTGPGTAGRAPMNPQMSWINDDYLPSLPPYEQVVSSPDQYPHVQPGQGQPSSGACGTDINRLPDLPIFPDVPGLPSVPSNSLGGASVGGDDVDFDDLARRFEELKRRK